MGRKKGLDFVRAISAIGIIAFHFYCHSSSEGKLFLAHANGAWGGVLNYLFFALSGLVLHAKYGTDDSLDIGKFYYKRWKAMMPAYLIVFGYAFLMNVFTYGRFFYMDIPNSRMLLTFIGMDGYFSWVTTTYFITGEWFLGAILVAYIMYPLLKKLMKKSEIATVLVLAALYFLMLQRENTILPQAVHPFTCLFSFGIGMIMATKFQYFKNPVVIVLAGLVFFVLLIVPVGGSNITKEMMIGWSLLILAYNLGEGLCRIKPAEKIIMFVSGLTYPTFLLHHRIIYKVLEGFDKTNTVSAFAVLVVIIAVTLMFSKILDIFMKHVFGSQLFKKMDARILK